MGSLLFSLLTIAGNTREQPMAHGKPNTEHHRASLPLEEACVSPCLAVGTSVLLSVAIWMEKPLEMMLPWLRGGTKLSILDNWADLPWSHHLPADQAQPDQSHFQLSLALHGHLDVLAVTWGRGGDNGTPLCLRARHRGGGLGQ